MHRRKLMMTLLLLFLTRIVKVPYPTLISAEPPITPLAPRLAWSNDVLESHTMQHLLNIYHYMQMMDDIALA